MLRFLVGAMMAASVLGCAASAQTTAQQPAAQQRPCAGPEYRQLDFWVGDWDVRWEGSPDQPAGSGRNVITRQLGDCVIQEAFEGGPSTGDLIGHSVSVYHAGPGLWRQTWVDNQGGYFALTGGPTPDGKFILTNTRISETASYRRMVFEDIGPNALTWRWQGSADAGATWTDSWVIYYTRRAP